MFSKRNIFVLINVLLLYLLFRMLICKCSFPMVHNLVVFVHLLIHIHI